LAYLKNFIFFQNGQLIKRQILNDMEKANWFWTKTFYCECKVLTCYYVPSRVLNIITCEFFFVQWFFTVNLEGIKRKKWLHMQNIVQNVVLDDGSNETEENQPSGFLGIWPESVFFLVEIV